MIPLTDRSISFLAPSGGGLGKPPTNSAEKSIVRIGSVLFVLHSEQTDEMIILEELENEE